MANYNLRGVDQDIWRKAKARAAAEGRSLKYVIVEFLRVYGDHGFRVVETFDNRNQDKER